MSLVQAARAISASSSGASIQLTASSSTPVEGLVWFAVFQSQVVIADIIIVLPPSNSIPQPVVTDDAYQQVYRTYHIYDRNLYVCILPSITIAAAFGEFVLSLASPVCPPSSLNPDLVAAGCGVVEQLRNPTASAQLLLNWSTASFCLAIL